MSKRVVLVLGAVVAAAGLALAQPERKPPVEKKPMPAARPDAPAGKQPEKKPADDMGQTDRTAADPGPEHQKLAKLTGNWTSTNTLSMGTGEPTRTSGEAKVSMILGGRFMHLEETGQIMGQPYQSVKVWGYNSGSRKYESTWLWSNATSMMRMTGESKDDGKTVVCDASFDNEIGVTEKMTITLKISDDDHFSTTINGGKMPDGTDGPTMETKYARKR